MDFLKTLDKAVDSAGGNNDDFRSPKNGLLKLNTKNPRTVRIIPLPDAPYAFPYRVLWVELHTKKGDKTFPSMLKFPFKNNGDDKLMTLAQHIIHINYQYRNDNPSFTGDIIPLQYKHAGRPNFNASLRQQFALEAVQVVSDGKGGVIEDTLPASKIPKVQIMNVSTSVISNIQNSIETTDRNILASWSNAKTQKPYPLVKDDPMKLRWINSGDTMPVHIFRENKKGASYQVEPQPFNMLPPLPKELYAKDSDGKYKYIDDPKWLYEPSKTSAPTIYKMAYNELSKRLDEYKEGHHNPFQDQVKNVKSHEGSEINVDDSNVSSESVDSTSADSFAKSINAASTGAKGPQDLPDEQTSSQSEQSSSDTQKSASQTSQSAESDSSTSDSSDVSNGSSSNNQPSSDSKSSVSSDKAHVDKKVQDILNHIKDEGDK